MPEYSRAGSSGVAVLQDEDMEQHGRDVERLESALSARVRDVRSMEAELERRAILIRDLTARWETMPPAPGDTSQHRHGDEAQVTAARDAAIARALDAEAAALELRFRLDELAGHLSGIESTSQAALLAQLAQHEGALRGVRSRLAEAQDAQDRAEARLMLTEHDLEDARAECGVLRRQRLELGERLEIEALRARTAEAEVAKLRGELLGVRARADEAERAVQSSGSVGREATAVADDLRARIFVAMAERDAARNVLDMARVERDAALADGAQGRVELEALRDELAEREADLATVRAGNADSGDLRDRASRLHEALLDARQGLRELTAWLAGEGAPAPSASTTSFELEAPIGVSTRPPREDETLPGVPLHVQAMAAVETMAVEALEEQLAHKDEQLRALEARIDELLRRQGPI